MKSNFKYLLLFLIATLLLSGCMGLGSKATPSQKVLNGSSDEEMVTFDVDDGISDLSERIEGMKKDKVPFYVPNSYRLINKRFNWIVRYKENDGSEERLYKEIKKTDALIDGAYKRKKTIAGKLKETLNHYNTLLSLKSNVYFADRFEDLSDEMKDIINTYDATGGLFSSNEADMEAFEDVPELNHDMLTLEIDTVLAKEYLPVEIKLAQMEDNDFDDYAPITYRVAELKLIKFKSYIRLNHLNKSGIAKMKASLLFEYSHLQHLVVEVKYLIDEDSNEKVVLEQERKYLTLMNSLEIGDNRDKPLPQQYKIILSGIEKIKSTASEGIAANISKIAKLEKEITVLQTEAKDYQEEKESYKSITDSLNMEITTLKMKSENLAKELEKQKLINEELNSKKPEELYTTPEKEQNKSVAEEQNKSTVENLKSEDKEAKKE